LSKVNAVLDNQTAKGIQKYGHTLEECPVDKFNWQHMLIEELIDGVQYQQKEIDNLSYQLYEIEPCQSYKVNINDLIKDINLDDYKINFHDDYKINTLVIKMLIKTMDKQQNTINWLYDLVKE